MHKTDDVRINEIKELFTTDCCVREIPGASNKAAETVYNHVNLFIAF